MPQFNEAAIITDISNEHLGPQPFGYCSISLVFLHGSTAFGTSWRQRANKNNLQYKVRFQLLLHAWSRIPVVIVVFYLECVVGQDC